MTILAQTGAFACLLLFLTWIANLAAASTRRTRELPGPKGRPILGNVFDIPTTSPWLAFVEWRKRYGDIIGLRALGNRMVVLNSRKAIEDLLVERGTKYSGRPAFTLVTKCLGFDWSTVLLPPGEELNRQRRVFNHSIGSAAYKMHFPRITQSVHKMCLQILDAPDNIKGWTKLMVVKNLGRIAYGFKIKDLDDEYIILAEAVEKGFKDMATIGAHPIDVFPVLRFLPMWVWGSKFRQQVSILRNFTAKLRTVPYDLSRSNIAKGTSHPNSIIEIMFSQNLHPDGQTAMEDEHSIKGAAVTAYTAGAETTTETINSFILMMVCNPSVQAKAHEVVDKVFGGERLPEFVDREREDLVYIEALLREVYRWSSIVPLGVPHSLLKDDVYDGMLLNAGSTVIANVWGCLHDPEDYPNPQSFRPERFIEVREDDQREGMGTGPTFNIRLREDVPDPRSIAFGSGRRACPGRYIADSITWLTIVTILCTFELSKAPHPTEPGRFIEPDVELDSAMVVSFVKPFKCVVKSRSERVVGWLRNALEGDSD